MYETFNILWLSWTYQSNFQIFESSKALRYYQFSILKLVYFFFNDQLLLQVKNIFISVCFIKNESVNPYNTRDGKLLFIPHINAAHSGTKWIRYKKFKQFLNDLLLENY